MFSQNKWIWGGMAVFLFVYLAIRGLNRVADTGHIDNAKTKMERELDKALARKPTPSQINNRTLMTHPLKINSVPRIAPNPHLPNLATQPAAPKVAGMTPKKDDKKTDKKDQKKKKKKKDNKPSLQVNKPAPTSQSPDSKGRDSNNQAAGAGPGRPPLHPNADNDPNEPAIAGNNQKNPNLPQSAQAWIAAFLTPPTAAGVNTIVSYFNAGQIPPAEFYQIVDFLFKSNNPANKQLGVTALGTAPSAVSFEKLVLVTEHEQDPNLLTSVNNYLKIYYKASYVNFAAGALTSKDPKVQYVALTTIQASAQYYLSNQLQSGARNTASVKGASYFQSMVVYLKTYISQLKDQTLITTANTTLTTIQDLLAAHK